MKMRSKNHRAFKDISKARNHHVKHGGFLYCINGEFIVTRRPPSSMFVFLSQAELEIFCIRFGEAGCDQAMMPEFNPWDTKQVSVETLVKARVFRVNHEEGPDWAVSVTTKERGSLVRWWDDYFPYPIDYPASPEQLFEVMRRLTALFGVVADYDDMIVKGQSVRWAGK